MGGGVSGTALSLVTALLLKSKGSPHYSEPPWTVGRNGQGEEDEEDARDRSRRALSLVLGIWTQRSHEPLSPGRYFIRRTSDKGQFFQVNKQGNIFNDKELDREIHPWYNLTVEAKELYPNGEQPPLPGYLCPFPSLIQNWHNLSWWVSGGSRSSY